MEHLFNDIEKKIIEKLKNSKPKRIWYEFITVVFEFDDFYIELESVSEIADSQNKYDEAIAAKIREFKKAYKPSKNAKLISKNKLISEIKTVKTFLYFTDSISEPKKVKKLDSKWNRFMSKISNVKQSETEKILGGTSSSYHSVITCRPNSSESKKARPEFSNIIDVGLVLKIENEFLPVFVQSNSFGFGHLERKFLLPESELKKIINNYELN